MDKKQKLGFYDWAYLSLGMGVVGIFVTSLLLKNYLVAGISATMLITAVSR